MSRVLSFAFCAFLLASCKSNANNVILASLERSAKIQLLCADIESLPTSNAVTVGEFLPLDLCVEGTSFADDLSPNVLGAVTQTQTGTVAAMTFTRSFVLDTNITVPGVTALRVGEQPTGIQISPVAPNYTYVSSFSPKSVQAVPSEALLTGRSDLPVQDPIRFDAGPTDLALQESASFEEVVVDGAVTGAIATIDYRYLYVALPELGQIAEIRVDIVKDPVNGDRHGMMVALEPIQLNTYTCDSVTLVDPPASTKDDYNRICPEYVPQRNEGRVVKTVNTTTPCVDGPNTGPAPVALTIDRGLESDLSDDVLLVADANQPVIHRFALFTSGATPLDPIIVTGTPTVDVAVTPYVPASSDPDDLAATERYLYAISATDSSVLAIDYSEASPTFGAVLPVVAGVTSRANEEDVESRNRARFAFSNARAIEVISPDYALNENGDGSATVPEDSICDPNDGDAFGLAQNASNLRGVFLAVSLANGTMFFLDVYDLNAPCRGGEGTIACTVAETGPDRYASIRRHRRRIGLTPSTFVQLDGTPSIQFNAAPGQINEGNGMPSNSDGPGLEFIQCPPQMDDVSSMEEAYGIPPNEAPDDALICISSQIWSSITQGWGALWAGLIPNTEGGLGLFSDTNADGTETGNWFLAGDVPFCHVGVLGDQNLLNTDPDPNPDSDLSIDRLYTYVGDRLVITSDLPPNRRDPLLFPQCQPFVDLEEDIDDFQVWFPIKRAFNDQLEIGESTNSRWNLETIKFCFNQFTEYQIHTRQAYTVTGTGTGFINRVIPDADTNECILDPARPVDYDDVDTYLTGRAFPDTQFINPLVSFKIGAFPPETSVTDATVCLLNFNVSNQFGSLNIDTSSSRSSLPSSMLFSAPVGQLFFVDYVAGVKRLVFSPLNIAQTFD